MYTCTIIISHFESLNFLRAAIRQIRKYKHPEVEQNIWICEQSGNETARKVAEEFASADDIHVVKMKPHYSGYGKDFLFRYPWIDTDFVCELHADSFPCHQSWLYLPIKLIEEYNLSFVGQLQFISKPTDTIYPPNPFFAMAQCFNVARTETYKEMSLEAGFTRYHQRATLDMEFKNDDWAQWAKDDYKNRGSDDDVVAFHWQDKNRIADKLGLAVTGFIQPSFGRIIEDIVFHFGSARESVGVMGQMPEQYQDYYKKIQENYSDELIDEMISLAKANRPPELEILSRNLWNGKTKISSPPTDEINKRIEELKNG